ncbi:MAG: hypothetical protein R2701_09110 [Acidimicrobiales bacterium]
MSPKARDLDPDRLAALEEQRDFLLRSIEDLDREHAAGDLDDLDHQTLRDDYTARAAEVLRAIDAHRDGMVEAKRPRSLGRTLAITAAVAVFALAAGFAIAGAIGARKAGESASGGIQVEQTLSQRANECIPKIQTDLADALKCFDAVLAEDDQNAVALTWKAWTYSIASQKTEDPTEALRFGAVAAVLVQEAVDSDPSYSTARAFRAVIAYRNGRFEDAKEYLADFRANDPSAEAQAQIEQMGLEANIDAALAEATTTTAVDATTTTAPG